MTNLLSVITALHLAALSQIESGDNDRAIGAQGEVSRYQIKPEVWASEMADGKWPCAPSPTCPTCAWRVAKDIWEGRLLYFRVQHGNGSVTLEQLYLLWHRPARVLHPTRREAERAERFANLVTDAEYHRQFPNGATPIATFVNTPEGIRQ